MLFEKQPVIMCLYSYNHFGTNPMQFIKMKCCRAVSNEMLRSCLKMKCCGAISNEMLPSHLKWNVLEEIPNCRLKENSEQCLES